MLTINKDKEYESFRDFANDLISEGNLNQVGLGRLAKKLESTGELKAETISKLKNELCQSVQKSLDEENIDPTLFFFSLDTDLGLVKIDELQDLTSSKIKGFIDRAKKKLQETNIITSYNPELMGEGSDPEELYKRNQVLKLIRT